MLTTMASRSSSATSPAIRIANWRPTGRWPISGSGALAPRDGRDSIGQELLADCLAGVWAKGAATRDLLEPGDLEEAIHAAAAVGDDRIQEQATGQVTPETWTHGSADERTRAFRHGYEAGDGDGCGLPSIRPI